MNIRRLFLLCIPMLLIIGCSDGDNEQDAITPEGDPAQAARAFMTSFLNGDVETCQTYTAVESRESVMLLCQQRASVQSSVNTADLTFETLEINGRYALVQTGGTYEQSVVDPASGAVQRDVVNEPILLQMYYQDGFWRFDDFVNGN